MNDYKLNPNKVGVVVTCNLCGQRKKPIGRSAPLEWYLCDDECHGYHQDPKPGSLWMNESEEQFGYPVGNDGVRFK